MASEAAAGRFSRQVQQAPAARHTLPAATRATTTLLHCMLAIPHTLCAGRRKEAHRPLAQRCGRLLQQRVDLWSVCLTEAAALGLHPPAICDKWQHKAAEGQSRKGSMPGARAK